MKKLFKELEEKGWTVERGSGHVKLRHRDHGLVTCSSTPSCPYVEHKIKNDIRRAETGYWKRRGR